MAEKKTSPKQDKQTTNPFDVPGLFQDMFKMYDPENIAKLFDPKTFFAQMPALNTADLDVESVVRKNRASFDAMVEANKAAAATYQDMLEKQMDIFNRMTMAAQEAAKNMESTVSTGAAQKNAEIYADAAEKAFALMQELAEAAQSANQQAFDRLSGQVSAAMDELKKG